MASKTARRRFPLLLSNHPSPSTGGPERFDDDRVELGQVFLALWRRKGLILGCALLGAMLAYVAVSQITPRYTARASVMLDPRTIQVLSSDDVIADVNLNNPLLDSETVVLRSNLLLEDVIQSFPEDQLAPFDPANQPLPKLDQISQNLRRGLERIVDSVRGETEETLPVAPLMTPEQMRMRRLVNTLRQSMRVWREGQSYLISVSVETFDPVLATELANRIVQTYITRALDTRVSTVVDATSFLAQRVEAMRLDVEQAEAAVEDFRITQLAETGMSPEAIDQQMQQLSAQLALAQADLAQAQARYDQIQSVIERDGLTAAAERLSSPFVLSLRQELSELNRKDADLATQFGPEHPDRQRTSAAIRLVSQDLNEEVRKIVLTLGNEVEVARIRMDSIQRSLSQIEERAANLSRASLQLRQLEREADAVRDNYETMLDRLNETRASEQLQRPEARVVERAVIPGAPSAPRTMLLTALGGTLGFSAGIFLTFLLSLSKRGFQRASQLGNATGLPVLGSVLTGNWKSPKSLLRELRRAPYQGFVERLRQVRAAILLRTGGAKQGQVVLVTSSVANEGKTSSALALAYLEGMAKRSCLLLDFDLRKTELAKELSYDAKTDLAGVLLQGKPLEDAVFRVPDTSFDIVTLRRPMPQLADEILSDRVAQLISTVRERYDTIIIDTAPLLLVADARYLAKMSDFALLLVRQNQTHSRAVTETATSLAASGVPAIGLVLTHVDPTSEEDSYGVTTRYGYTNA